MSFLLRAALVIGTLSYLAAMRGQSGTPSGAPGTAPLTAVVGDALPALMKALPAAPASAGALSAALNAIPPDARQRIAHEAFADLGRRIGPAAASRDTLAETDRRAAWRGAEGR